MKYLKSIAAVLSILSLLVPSAIPALAQIDSTLPPPPPAADTTSTAPATEPVTTPEADTVAPHFISIATVSGGETEASIVWTTDELAYGHIEYGPSASYGQTALQSADAALGHAQSITNLTPGTLYHYRIVAKDESGNIAYSEDRILETAVELVVADNVPPEISSVTVSSISTSGVAISWTTNELAQGNIEYGLTENYGSASALASDYAMDHSATLSRLAAGTLYHYRVVVQDEAGNAAVTPDETFTTDTVAVSAPPPPPVLVPPPPAPPPPPPATPPPPPSTSEPTASSTPAVEEPVVVPPLALSLVETISIGTSSALITWKTNQPSSARVLYGTSQAYASSTPLRAPFQESHQLLLTGLAPGTNYVYKVVSKNALGETAAMTGFEFNTLYEEMFLRRAPMISNVAAHSVGTSTALLAWDTDIPSAGEVKFGTTTAYEENDGGHTNLLTAHQHPLSGLEPDTLYHFVAIVRSQDGNETIYEAKTFRTLARASQASNAQSAAPVGDSNVAPTTVTDETTVAPTPSARGGGIYSHTPTLTLAPPKLTKVEALDGQVMFVWNGKKSPKAALPGSTGISSNTVIVRNSDAHPHGPTAGRVVYSGNSGLFADINLENGKTYYYSVFTINQFNSYSQPTRFEVTPTQADDAVTLDVVPPVRQKTPIFTFPHPLQVGDASHDVRHLQVLLGTDPALYPEGLITGYFGPLTKKAVEAFQTKHNLPATGRVGEPMLAKLHELSRVEAVAEKASPWSRDLKIGSSGEDVSRLQQFLVDVEAYPEALVTGYFGSLTQKALQVFQRQQHIDPPAGYFGSVTQHRARELIRVQGN